ncbi:MAG TPA: hypothetical protein VK796_11870 [Cytophaga sp.]|jgi:hypothetical protein|nr:hypothetical protein [Cytophaga sp.]
MSYYKFTTNGFGISETGIHLLRSNFNYKTIDFKDITLVQIKKGKLINNWLLIFIFGIGLITFSSYCVFKLVIAFNDDSVRRIFIEQIILPVLPLLLGGFRLYTSARNGMVITIRNNRKDVSYPLEDLIKKDEYQDFIDYLKLNKDVNSKLNIYRS